MLDIVAFTAAKWHTAGQVAAKPATDDAWAPLGASSLKPSSCLHWFVAIWTFDLLRQSFAKDTRHTLVFLQFFGAQEFCELFLARILRLCCFIWGSHRCLVRLLGWPARIYQCCATVRNCFCRLAHLFLLLIHRWSIKERLRLYRRCSYLMGDRWCNQLCSHPIAISFFFFDSFVLFTF